MLVSDVISAETKRLGQTMLERFLIVDDHPLFREALQNAIHLAFPVAEILEASSIEAAQKIFEAEENIDLLLLDLSMPGHARLRRASGPAAAAPTLAGGRGLGA